eukprot:m.1332393 g.1332393  ORF g.1332393 m.1332393 type:complete len:95 (-) comp24869_c0_seq4:213-497(-)
MGPVSHTFRIGITLSKQAPARTFQEIRFQDIDFERASIAVPFENGKQLHILNVGARECHLPLPFNAIFVVRSWPSNTIQMMVCVALLTLKMLLD